MLKLFGKTRARLEALEVVVDALIGVLVRKKTMSREDIQRQILEAAHHDKEKS